MAHPDTKQIYTDTTPTQIPIQTQVTMNKKQKENEAHHKSLCKKTQKCVEDQDQSLLMMKMDHKGGFVILGDEDSVNISKDNAVVREGLKELAANMEIKIREKKDKLKFTTYNLDIDKTFHLPKFKIQFKKKGWTAPYARTQVRNILANYGFGRGEYKSYSATAENKAAMRPAGWPERAVKWSTFQPHTASLDEANAVIEHLLRQNGIDAYQHYDADLREAAASTEDVRDATAATEEVMEAAAEMEDVREAAMEDVREAAAVTENAGAAAASEDVREEADMMEAIMESVMEAVAATENVREENMVEAARNTLPCGAVEDIISARRLSLPARRLSLDPGTKITWPALPPQFFDGYPSKSEMRSWPWPASKSPPPQEVTENDLETGGNNEKRKQIDDSDTDEEESPYERMMLENVKQRQRKFAELEIASVVANVKKPPRAKKQKIRSQEPVRKSRRLANKSTENVTGTARGEAEAEDDSMGL